MPAFFIGARAVRFAVEARMVVAHPQPPRSRIESEVLRARSLLEKRQFAQALALSESLLGEARELVIVHNGREYRLRLTQNGKLILTA